MMHSINEYGARLRRTAVVTAPTAHRRTLTLALGLGELLAAIGAFPLVFGSILFIASATSDQTNLTPSEALLFLAWGPGLGLAIIGLGVGIHYAARDLERRQGVLRPRDIATAPTTLAQPMCDALNAADTIRNSIAYRDNWLRNIDVDAALWDLARHLQAGSQLDGLIKEAPPTDLDAIEAAGADLAACIQHVEEVSNRLITEAVRVKQFDRQLTEPDRLAELERKRAAMEARDAAKIAKLTEVRTELRGIEPAATHAMDQLTTRLDVYQELPVTARHTDPA